MQVISPCYISCVIECIFLLYGVYLNYFSTAIDSVSSRETNQNVSINLIYIFI